MKILMKKENAAVKTAATDFMQNFSPIELLPES